jgi:hypothetical protein
MEGSRFGAPVSSRAPRIIAATTGTLVRAACRERSNALTGVNRHADADTVGRALPHGRHVHQLLEYFSAR